MAGSPAFAAPPSQLSILRACGDADTAAQCERMLEAGQIRQFPTIAVREVGALRLKTRSGASIELRDKGVPGSDEGAGFRFYSLWDYWPIQQTAIVSVSAQSGDHYLIVDLNRGSQTKVGAEPVLSPSGTRFVVVDFCETECGNAIELWHFDRDRIVRERTFRPREKWYDADVSWKDPTSLEIEYSVAAPSGEKGSDAAPVPVRARPMLLRITDRAWTDEAVR